MKLVGQPKKYKTGLELEKGIATYFDSIIVKVDGRERWQRVPTVGAMCAFLGVSDDTLYTYEKQNDKEYLETIKRARKIIEYAKIDALVNGDGSTNGLKFDLINNYGWTEKQEVKQTGESQIQIINNHSQKVETLELDD